METPLAGLNVVQNPPDVIYIQNPPDGIAAGPVTEENFFDWEAAITGPEVS